MNLASLALALVFAAVAVAFLGQARKESDPQQVRNKKFAGIAMLVTGAAFFVSFLISAVNR